jgi:hypothetical protein
LTNNEKLLTMASSTVEGRVAATVITLKDSLSLDVLLQALDRGKRMLTLAIDLAKSKTVAALDRRAP